MVNGVTINENLRGQPLRLVHRGRDSGDDRRDRRHLRRVRAVRRRRRQHRHEVGRQPVQRLVPRHAHNDNWRALTPFAADTKVNDVLPAYEYTLGGPVLHDRLWFFTAGRFQDTKDGRTTAITNLPYTFSSQLRRYEGKGTYSLISNHRFEGAYIASTDHQTNASQNPANVMDTNSLYNPQRNLNLIHRQLRRHPDAVVRP